jgi:uncharacterized protein YjbJ (UPF0337 family)
MRSSGNRLQTHRKEINMNWDRIEDNCKQFNGNVIEQWDDLTENQLSSCIRETYGITDDEAECELSGWQLRLNEINRAALPRA